MLYVYMYLFIALFNFFNNTYFDLKTKQKIKQHFGTTVKTKKAIPKTFLWLHTHIIKSYFHLNNVFLVKINQELL